MAGATALALIAIAAVAAPRLVEELRADRSTARIGLARAAGTSTASRFPVVDRRERSRLAEPARRRADDSAFAFDAGRAIAHATALAALGVRQSGSAEERRGADYIASQLRSMGYGPEFQDYSLPNGKRGVNVIARAPGSTGEYTIIVGGHMDTKPPSPGANDNASGCGVALELARQLSEQPAAADVEFIFWGAEEMLPQGTDSHHLGSRYHESTLTADQRRRLAAVFSIDMVGVGSRFELRTMKRGPQMLRDLVLAEARTAGISLSYRPDKSRTGLSDHEPYERAGLPAVCLSWENDTEYHTANDTAGRLQIRPVDTTGRLMLRLLYGLDSSRLAKLAEH